MQVAKKQALNKCFYRTIRYHNRRLIIALVLCGQQIFAGWAISRSIAQENAQTIIGHSNQVPATNGSSFAENNGKVLDFESHFLLAQHYFSRADFKLAELEIEEAIALQPNSPSAHRFYCLIALMHLHIGRFLAESMMSIGLGHAIALTSAEQVELNNECATAHYRKGLSYEGQNRFPRAISELKIASYYAPLSIMILRSLAFNLSKGGLFDQAEKYYQESFKLSPQEGIDDAYAHADYAYLLVTMGRQDDAIAQLEKAIQIAPKVAALHVDLSLFLEAKGNLEQATKEIQIALDTAPKYNDPSAYLYSSKTIRHAPTYANLWAHLGRLLDKQNEWGQAKGAYQYALTLGLQEPEIKTRLSELDKNPPVNYALSAVSQAIETRVKQLQKL
jgi:tetratricopeptide (TPR) repeat protein